jgi:hypothetical protein
MLNGIKPTIKVGNSFSLIPEGVLTLQIVDVNLEQTSYLGVEKDVLNYKFAILDDIEDQDGGKARGRFMWKRCSLSLNPKSWLNKLAVAVVGHELSDKEKEEFDPESLVGQQVSAMVEQRTSQDGASTYNNILKFSRATKKLAEVEYHPQPSVIETTSKPIDVDKKKRK